MEQKYWKDFWLKRQNQTLADSQLKVGRTINGIPISEDLWQMTISFLISQLELNKEDRVLDIA